MSFRLEFFFFTFFHSQFFRKKIWGKNSEICSKFLLAILLWVKCKKPHFDILNTVRDRFPVKQELRKTEREKTAAENLKMTDNPELRIVMTWKFGSTGLFGTWNRLVTFSTPSDKQEWQVLEQCCQVLKFFVSQNFSI